MDDLISRLRELRQSAESSVALGIESPSLPGSPRPRIPDPLDSWLTDLVLSNLDAGSSLRLLVLAGNSGDGKSVLLESIRDRIVSVGLHGKVNWVLDATQSDRTEPAHVRIAAFFDPFNDSGTWDPDRLHIIAINTGAIIQFFRANQPFTTSFSLLEEVLNAQLGFRRGSTIHNRTERFDKVLVVDLDRRSLLPRTLGNSSFFEKLLDTVDPQAENGILAGIESSCEDCVARRKCPVPVNLLALRHSRARSRLIEILLDVACEDRVHLSPRALWHLLYVLTVGGLDSEALARGTGLPTCDTLGDQPDEVLSAGLFYNAAFDAGVREEGGGAQALLHELVRLDPARRFSLDILDVSLQAGLTSQSEIDLVDDLARELDMDRDALVSSAPPEQRVASSVRRHFFFAAPHPDRTRADWIEQWLSLVPQDPRQIDENNARMVADALRTVLRDEFGSPSRELFRLQLPWKAKQALFTHARLGNDPASVDPRPYAGPDRFRPAGARKQAIDLTTLLRWYPDSIQVTLRQGPSVVIQWPFFRMLQRIALQGYLPASLEPEKYQHLQRIGVALAQTRSDRPFNPIAVFDGDEGYECEFDNCEFIVDRL